MCIIFNARVFQAEQTLLINAPIATPPGQPQQWQLIYINSMSRHSSRFNASSKDGPLMVFAIPNPHGMDEQDFTLFEINGPTAASIRLAADTLSDNYSTPFTYPTPQTGPLTFGAAAAPQPKLQVQKIGSYKISVAPSLASLVQRAPWDQYGVHKADVSRILEDMRKRYSASNFAFVIAEGTALAFVGLGDKLYFDDTGFGILYRNASVNGCFFPTSHEPKFSPDSGAANETDMDVKLIALGAVIRPLSIATPAQHSGLKIEGSEAPFGYSDFREASKTASFVVRADDSANKVISGKWSNVHSLLSRLPRFGAGEMHRHKYVEHEKIRVATAWNLEGSYLNKDVVARKATNNDVAVVDRMLLDLDSWIYHRTTLDKAVGSENLNGIGTMFSFSPTAVIVQRWWKVNFALALLARQLADPGINDRISDVVCRVSGEKRDCASVAYLNLDLSDIDLDEDSYAEKDTYARRISKAHETVDTINSSYIRISATLGPYESLQMRTVSER